MNMKLREATVVLHIDIALYIYVWDTHIETEARSPCGGRGDAVEESAHQPAITLAPPLLLLVRQMVRTLPPPEKCKPLFAGARRVSLAHMKLTYTHTILPLT